MNAEISFADMIRIIWRGKVLIAIGTIASILLSFILFQIISVPQYSSTTILMVDTKEYNKDGGLESTINLTPYITQATSSKSLDNIATKLLLDKKHYTSEEIRNATKIEYEKDSSLLSISVKDKSPENSANIANHIAFELAARIEIFDRTNNVVRYSNELFEINNRLKVVSSELEQSQKILKELPEKIITEKSLTDQPYLQSIVNDTLKNNAKINGAIQFSSEEINSVYTQLKSKEVLSQVELSKLQAEKQNIENHISENKNMIQQLENQQINKDLLNSDNTVALMNGLKGILVTPSQLPTEPSSSGIIIKVILVAIITTLSTIIYLLLREYTLKSLGDK